MARQPRRAKVIRSDNGKEFCGKAMVIWAHERGVQLRLIEPGKPNQNAYIESFNGQDPPLRRHPPRASPATHQPVNGSGSQPVSEPEMARL